MNSMKNGMFAPTEEAIRPVSCGFVGIYANSIDDAALYAATDQARQYLVLMPLTPNWYWTAYRIISKPTYQRIWLVMPNMDQRMISDMINLFFNFSDTKYEFHIVYPEPIQDAIGWSPYSAAMLHQQCVGESTRIMGLDFSIHFQSLGQAAPAGRYGIELISQHGRHLFINEMRTSEGPALLENIRKSDQVRAYTWISMPYRYPTYGGMSMFDAISSFNESCIMFRTQLCGRLVPYNFRCPEELQEAKEKASGHNPYMNIPARLIL